jgi:transcriptional regulator with XRE-family HTH domain
MSEKRTRPTGALVFRAPSAIFRERLREIRVARGLTQEALAARMTDAGFPMQRKTVIEIEAGTRRRVTLDEAFALAYVLDAAPAHMLTPTDDSDQELFAPTPREGWSSGAAVRNWLLLGDALARRPDTKRAANRWRAADRLARLSTALLDAERGGDAAAAKGASKAIAELIREFGNELDAL